MHEYSRYVLGGKTVSIQEAINPKTNAQSLVPLGAPPMAGLGRRPLWASSRTTSAVAVNVWRAREADKRHRASAGGLGTATDRSRAFAKTWEVNYANFPTEDRWNPSAVADLKRKIDANNQVNEMKGKRPRLYDPGPRREDPPSTAHEPPAHPIRRLGAQPADDVTHSRERDIEVPLPAMTREFKRARLNLPPSQEAGETAPSTTSSLPRGSDARGGNRNGLKTNQVYQHGADGELPNAKHLSMHVGGTSSSATGAGASSSVQMSSTSAPGGAIRRARTSSSRGVEDVPCAACGTDSPIFGSRFLPNAPWTSQTWRGARPGTMVCVRCYGEYVDQS